MLNDIQDLNATSRSMVGDWTQETVEKDKLQQILMIQEQPWLIRTFATNVMMYLSIRIGEHGDIVYTCKTPLGTYSLGGNYGTRLNTKVLKIMTMDLVMADCNKYRITLYQKNTYGKNASAATITLHYDAATDKIISNNFSAQGSYVRTFKRVGATTEKSLSDVADV